MQNLRSIEELDLSRKNLTDTQLAEELSQLGNITHINRLDLSFNKLTHITIVHLAKLAQEGVAINFLDLTGNPLGAPASEWLPKLNLKECHLNATKMDCSALMPFKNNPDILHLGFDRDVDHEDFTLFAQAIEKNIDHNREVLKARLVQSTIILTQAFLQNEALFHTLPKPIFEKILILASHDFQFAYTYSAHFDIPLKSCIHFVMKELERIKNSESKAKHDHSLFFRACSKLPIGNQKPYEEQESEESLSKLETNQQKKCIIC